MLYNIIYTNNNYWNFYIKHLNFIFSYNKRRKNKKKTIYNFLRYYRRRRKLYISKRSINRRKKINRKKIQMLTSNKFKLLNFYYCTKNKIKKVNYGNNIFDFIRNSNVYK